jgi:hypothetical protein
MSNGYFLADTNSLVYAYRAGGSELLDTYLDVPASGELGLIEGARLVGDGLRCVALLHGVFLDRLQWQRARHTLFTERLENGLFLSSR